MLFRLDDQPRGNQEALSGEREFQGAVSMRTWRWEHGLSKGLESRDRGRRKVELEKGEGIPNNAVFCFSFFLGWCIL